MAYADTPRYGLALPGVEIQNSDSLIWILRYPAVFRIGDFRQLFIDLKRLNPECRKHAVLVDMSAINPLTVSAASRREAAEVLNEHADFLAMTCLCEGRVAPNPIIRGMLTVFDWLAPKPWTINNLFSGEAAELWLRGHLAKLGFVVPVQSVWPPQASVRPHEFR